MAVIGKNILGNLTTGMYVDSKVIYREYIQNACDQIDKAEATGILEQGTGQIDIKINPIKRKIEIKDNATGISQTEFQHQLGDIANSDKERGKDRGFRGIGRLCGLAYCHTLVFRTTAHGENVESIMTIDAKKMRAMLEEKTHYNVEQVLAAIVTYSSKTANNDDHYFAVEMIDINLDNSELLDKERVRLFLSFVAPVPFKNTFRARTKIAEYAQNLKCPILEYRIYIEGDQLFKGYTQKLYEKLGNSKKSYDEIIDVAFYDIRNSNNELLAWMWYGLYRFEKAIPKNENPMYGLRLRQSNIEVGDNTVFAEYFKEERGNSYFVGEIYAVHPDLIPNSQRDYFNESALRNELEDKIRSYCYDTLTPLYYKASKTKRAYRDIQEYQKSVNEYKKKTQTGFLNDQEKSTLAARLTETKKKAEDGRKLIEKISTEENSTDPTVIVQQTIKNNYSSTIYKKEIQNPIQQETADTQKKQQTTYWADSLSKLDKNKRKLVAQVLAVVSKHTDAETLKKIQADLVKEFK